MRTVDIISLHIDMKAFLCLVSMQSVARSILVSWMPKNILMGFGF